MAGMGINGSSPCGCSAVIQPASSHVQQQNKQGHASRRSLAIRPPGRGLGAPGGVTHSSRTGGSRRFAVDRFVDRVTGATVRSGPSAARLRGIRAGSAYDAQGRTSHNPLVVGSSPTRPTETWAPLAMALTCCLAACRGYRSLLLDDAVHRGSTPVSARVSGSAVSAHRQFPRLGRPSICRRPVGCRAPCTAGRPERALPPGPISGPPIRHRRSSRIRPVSRS
jgi:hypothetical protein